MEMDSSRDYMGMGGGIYYECNQYNTINNKSMGSKNIEYFEAAGCQRENVP